MKVAIKLLLLVFVLGSDQKFVSVNLTPSSQKLGAVA
jgi:hypothetical protein